MDQSHFGILEAQREQVEYFIAHGTARSLHLKALYEAGAALGVPTAMCHLSPNPDRLKTYLTKLYDKYNEWLTQNTY